MKIFFTIIFMLATLSLALASITDPVGDFKVGLTIPAGDKILRWECDLNGDGKNDVLLTLKSLYSSDPKDDQIPGWTVYIGESTNSFIKSTGTETSPGELSVDDLPNIDPNNCFIGQIAELNKRGIVTVAYATKNPQEVTTTTVYAYTIDGDHLVRTQLAQYDPDQGGNAIFDKYLTDTKRTKVTLQEVTP